MPERPLTDLRALLESGNAESTSLPPVCCASAAGVALTGEELRLLADLRTVLPERTKEGGRITRIGSSAVLLLLETAPGSPWRGLSPHKLARMLGSAGVHPHVIRFNHGVNGVRRGYIYDELRSAFLTLLPPCGNPGLMRGPSV